MWKECDLSDKNIILIPFNPSNIHWVLVVVNIRSRKVILLDPLNNAVNQQEHLCKQAMNLGKRLLALKFGLEADGELTTIKHVKQPDSKSCGVFTCYYAEQIAKGIAFFFMELKKNCDHYIYTIYIL